MDGRHERLDESHLPSETGCAGTLGRVGQGGHSTTLASKQPSGSTNVTFFSPLKQQTISLAFLPLIGAFQNLIRSPILILTVSPLRRSSLNFTVALMVPPPEHLALNFLV